MFGALAQWRLLRRGDERTEGRLLGEVVENPQNLRHFRFREAVRVICCLQGTTYAECRSGQARFSR